LPRRGDKRSAQRDAQAYAAAAEENRASGGSVPGQVELTKRGNWVSMSKKSKNNWI
jgi:hypothetical protein